jgi:hypothetical protein
VAQNKLVIINLRAADGAQQVGEWHALAYSGAERALRALKVLGLVWGAALLILPIPIAHLSVPLLAVAGPVGALWRYRTREAAQRVIGPCPACKAALTVPLETADSLPKWIYCPACSRPLELTAQTTH